MSSSSGRSRIEVSPMSGLADAIPGPSTSKSGDNHDDHDDHDALQKVEEDEKVIIPPTTVRSLVLPCMMEESIAKPKIATLRSNKEDGYNNNLALFKEITISNGTESKWDESPIWSNIKVKLFLQRKAAGNSKGPIVSNHNYSKIWPTAKKFQTYNMVKFLFMKPFLDRSPGAMKAFYPDGSSGDNCSYEYLKNFPFLESQTVASDQSEAMAMDTEESSGSLEVEGNTLNPDEAEKKRLWSQAFEIIHSESLYRFILTGQVSKNALEVGLTEHSAKEFSNLLASVKNIGSSKWLHENLLKHFGNEYRSNYLKTLDFINKSNPELVSPFYEPIPGGSAQNKRPKGVKPKEHRIYFFPLLYHRMKKLPHNPHIVLVPNRVGKEPKTPRMEYWIRMFKSMGILITFPRICVLQCRTIRDVCEMVSRRINLCRIKHSRKPIVLVGFGQAAMVAYFLSLTIPRNVAVLVCFGFQMDDNSFNEPVISELTDIAIPTQIIIGQKSKKISVKHIDDFTSKLQVKFNLVIVGDADDDLKIISDKSDADDLNQIIADLCIADEMYDHCALALTYNFVPSCRIEYLEFGIEKKVLYDLDNLVYPEPEPDQSRDRPKMPRRLTEENDPELFEKRRHAQIATMMVMSGGSNSILANHLKKQRLSDVYPNSRLTEEQLQRRELARMMETGRKAIENAMYVDSDSDSD